MAGVGLIWLLMGLFSVLIYSQACRLDPPDERDDDDTPFTCGQWWFLMFLIFGGILSVALAIWAVFDTLHNWYKIWWLNRTAYKWPRKLNVFLTKERKLWNPLTKKT